MLERKTFEQGLQLGAPTLKEDDNNETEGKEGDFARTGEVGREISEEGDFGGTSATDFSIEFSLEPSFINKSLLIKFLD